MKFATGKALFLKIPVNPDAEILSLLAASITNPSCRV